MENDEELITETGAPNVAAAPTEIIKIIYINKWHYCLDCIEYIDKQELQSKYSKKHLALAAIKSLWRASQPMLQKSAYKNERIAGLTVSTEFLKLMTDNLSSGDLQKALLVFDWVALYLYEKHIIMADIRETYDYRSPESTNRAKGMG